MLYWLVFKSYMNYIFLSHSFLLIPKGHTVDGVNHHLLVVEAGEGDLFLRDGVELMILARYSDYLLFDWLVRFQHFDIIVMCDVFLDYNFRDSFQGCLIIVFVIHVLIIIMLVDD